MWEISPFRPFFLSLSPIARRTWDAFVRCQQNCLMTGYAAGMAHRRALVVGAEKIQSLKCQ
jgi:hypothetical protein